LNRSAAASDVEAIAARLVQARRGAEGLEQFPYRLPVDAAEAYACQEAAIALWPDTVAGWKVGWVGEEWRGQFPQERLVGPVFARSLRMARVGEVVEADIFAQGFAAVEAEFVFRIGADAPPGRTAWTTDDAAGMVASMHMAIEIASSPLATINALGPKGIVADFGNNAGLIVGAPIPDWRKRDVATLRSSTSINGKLAGSGGAESLSGGPLAALAFALGQCARLGLPLRAGQFICTGATTGIHAVTVGDEAEVVFEGTGKLQCRLRGMTPC
jgi:2-keto-4-pentenoate hydratase